MNLDKAIEVAISNCKAAAIMCEIVRVGEDNYDLRLPKHVGDERPVAKGEDVGRVYTDFASGGLRTPTTLVVERYEADLPIDHWHKKRLGEKLNPGYQTIVEVIAGPDDSRLRQSRNRWSKIEEKVASFDK